MARSRLEEYGLAQLSLDRGLKKASPTLARLRLEKYGLAQLANGL
jgi:hypothetical protein